MNNMKTLPAVLITIILCVSMIINLPPLLPWRESTQPPIMSEISSKNTNKDVLIINDPQKYAYFGWYRPTHFSLTIWDLLNRTVLWASSYTLSNETKIVLFRDPTDTYAAEVYSWLIGGGYLVENIILHTTSDVELLSSDYYDDCDLVIYWNTYGYDSTNIVNSIVPFITISAMQTDEMGIGSGIATVSDYNDTFHIVNNNYYPTESYSLGPLLFDDSYHFEATEASDDGKVLIKAEVTSVSSQVEMSNKQDITVLANGSANMVFNITIPKSPLADIILEAFFTNVSSLQPEVEYEVPDKITVNDKANVEKGIKAVSLKGDIDGDGQVKKEDIEFITTNLECEVGDEDWNAELDLNWDGKIDMRDVAIAAHNYGKTTNNTGNLYVAGYYDGITVNCTNVYFRGPEGSAKMNISESGHVWYHVLPGIYTVFGSYNGIEKNTMVIVEPKKVTYAQIDFGGLPPQSIQTESAPVKEVFYQGIVMEQLLLLGFDINVTQSKIVPWSTNNETRITLMAYSPQLAEPMTYPNWQINIGPENENAIEQTAEFVFSKIEYMMIMLQSLPGDQIYVLNWQMGIDLPSGSVLLNENELSGLNWTIDFGGGTFMQANVTVESGRVVVDEKIVVTERNITATEGYLSAAFAQYKVFSINYTHTSMFKQVKEAKEATSKLKRDWSKTWRFKITPGSFMKTWSLSLLSITLKATPTLSVEWFLGWEKRISKLQWFETWMKITPSIKVEASATIKVSYTKTWSYTFWTWSHRFSFWVGCIPVWANLQLKVTGSITLTAYGKISISTGAELLAWYKAGIRWEKENGWNPIWQHGSGVSRYGPSISGEVGLSVTPAAACRLSFLLYDVGGPFVEAVPYLPIKIIYYTNKPNTWSINLKFKIIVGVTLAGWLEKILKISSYSKTVADWTLMSWGGTWP
ncbi:MAG: dockerin type I domain-containing protein [Candidatus Hermodarchaeota archaeon]